MAVDLQSRQREQEQEGEQDLRLTSNATVFEASIFKSSATMITNS